MPRGVSKQRRRKAANTHEEAAHSVNESILGQVKKLYVDSDDGIESIAKALGEDVLHPRNKVTVMIIGNHSAGKSSFVNWLVPRAPLFCAQLPVPPRPSFAPNCPFCL